MGRETISTPFTPREHELALFAAEMMRVLSVAMLAALVAWCA